MKRFLFVLLLFLVSSVKAVDTVTALDSLVLYNSTDGCTPPVIVSDGIYAVGHGKSTEIWVSTFSVDNSTGEIAKIDSLKLETMSWFNRANCTLLKINNSNYYALFWKQATVNDIWVTSVYIGSDGDIASAKADDLEVDEANCYFSGAFNYPGTDICVAAGRTAASGVFRQTQWSFDISSTDGTITQLDSVQSNFPTQGESYSIAYAGNSYWVSLGYRNGSSLTTGTVNSSTGALAIVWQDSIHTVSWGAKLVNFATDRSKLFFSGKEVTKRVEGYIQVDTTDGSLLVTPRDSWVSFGLASNSIHSCRHPLIDSSLVQITRQSTLSNALEVRNYTLEEITNDVVMATHAVDSLFGHPIEYNAVVGACGDESNIFITVSNDLTDDWLMVRTFSVGDAYTPPDTSTTYYASLNVQPAGVTLTTFSVGMPSGAISDTVIDQDTLATDSFDTETQGDLINITGTALYVAVWADADNSGIMEVRGISEEGVITDAQLDSITFASYAQYPMIRQEPETNYFTVSYFDGTDSKVKSYSITDAGDINPTAIDSVDITNVTYAPKLAYLDSSCYTVTGWGSGTDGYISTFKIIPGDGSLSAVLDNAEFQPWNYYSTAGMYRLENSVHSILASRAITANYWSFEIHCTTGDIIGTTTESGFSTPAYQPRDFKATSTDTILVEAFSDPDADGWIRTFSMNSVDGTTEYITAIDSLEIETSQGDPMSLVASTDSTLFVVGGQGDGANEDGLVYSFTASASGDLSEELDRLETETSNVKGMTVLQLLPVSSPAGPADVAKVSGVAAGTITKIGGINYENIKSIMGIE